MYSYKFKSLNYFTNHGFNNNLKKLIILPGLGCEAKEYKYLFGISGLRYQIIIFEIPGHNFSSLNYRYDYLLEFAKQIFLFIKCKNIKNITFYAHSISCITVILLFKNFIKNHRYFKFIINEGNLIESDCSNVTKKTTMYEKDYFINSGFTKLCKLCSSSSDIAVKNWSLSLSKVSSKNFYFYCKSAIRWTKNTYLLSYYKILFKKKIYIYGEKSKNQQLLGMLNGERKVCMKEAGHFSHTFNKLKLKRVLIEFLNKSE